MVFGAVLYIGNPAPTVDAFLRAAPIAFLTSALSFYLPPCLLFGSCNMFRLALLEF